jgi:hypothetical protein
VAIDVSSFNGETVFLVRYAEYCHNTMDDNIWACSSVRDLLELAFRATEGAVQGETKVVGDWNISGLMEDHADLCECVIRLSRENTAALLASRLVWSPKALSLANGLNVPQGRVAEVQHRVEALYQEDWRERMEFLEQSRRRADERRLRNRPVQPGAAQPQIVPPPQAAPRHLKAKRWWRFWV